jgi:hypothetical protein
MDIAPDYVTTFVFNKIPAFRCLTCLFFNEIPASFVHFLRVFADSKGHSGFVRHFLKLLGGSVSANGGQFDLSGTRPTLPAKPCA